MKNKLILVFDCGATNVRCIAVGSKGEIVASHSVANNTYKDPFLQGGLIWDIDVIWKKLVGCAKLTLAQIDPDCIAGITLTSFGVDGAPVHNDASLLYPVISWACQRTEPIMEHMDRYIPLERLYGLSGVHKFGFNTINKLIWFKENRSDILEEMDHYLFISSILLHRLCNVMVTESTMAGTSMLTNHQTRGFSTEIFDAIGVENKFPEMVEPGTVVGETTDAVYREIGIPKGIPVVAAGHDTQFAVFGSGAKENEVVLSSGTWEILMARTRSIATHAKAFEMGITNEWDAVAGLYNPGVQWLGSSVLEGLINKHFSHEKASMETNAFYDWLITQASGVEEGSNKNKREELYRGALASLARKTRESLELLEENCGFKAESIYVVGGGSKNRLWNELRAKELGIPLKLIDNKETTVLGAALFAMAAVGMYVSSEEARAQVKYNTEIIVS